MEICIDCNKDADEGSGIIYVRRNTDNVPICTECWRKTRE